jgi:hypothetical protein
VASYATLADVKARAGAVGQAWYDTSAPSATDVERLIDQVAGELNAYIAGEGYDTTSLDDTAKNSLTGVNADKALLLALDATYAGDNSITELRASVKARVDAYDKAMEVGDMPALLYLSATGAGAQQGGASDFWTVDGVDDYYWSLYAGRLGAWPWVLDPFGIPPSQSPVFRKGMRL